VDMPPNTPREEYRCRISIARQGAGAEANRPLAEFHSDRAQRVNLLPQTAPSSLQFEAEATDLSLDVNPEDYANQPSRVDIEIYALTPERAPERRRVESRSIFIDTQGPEVHLQDQNRQTLEVEQDKPLAVVLTAIDRPNGGIARVELAFQRENGALVNPVQAFAIREGSDTYQATVPTKDRPPGAHHELWYQATDRVGNVSPPASVSVFIKPPSPMASGAAATKNAIRGVVRRAGRGIAGIKVELSGQTTKNTSSATDGSFSFTDLTPGAYTLSARGFIAGTGFKSPDTPATVAPPPAAPAFIILELQ
jgi:carboxypeptidase family protein